MWRRDWQPCDSGDVGESRRLPSRRLVFELPPAGDRAVAEETYRPLASSHLMSAHSPVTRVYYGQSGSEVGFMKRPVEQFLAGILATLLTFSPALAAPQEKEKERSEEHTSELQSRLHLVCRLLLEKKKKLAAHKRQLTSPPLS